MPENVAMSGMEWVFAGSAAIGAVLLVARIILMMLGLGEGSDGASGHDFSGNDISGHDVSGHDVVSSADAHHSDSAFRTLSLQGIMAFLLMFGLVGLAMARASGTGAGWALVGGTAAGLAAVYVIGKLFSLMVGFQSSGTITLTNAIGQEGRVYLTVGPAKEGKVEVPVQGRLMVLDAIAVGGEDLPTGTIVMVERLVGEELLGVVRIEPTSRG